MEEEEAKRRQDEEAKRKEDQNTVEGGSNSGHVSKAKTKKGKAKQGSLGHGTPLVEGQRGTKCCASTEGTQEPLHSRGVTPIITALPTRVVRRSEPSTPSTYARRSESLPQTPTLPFTLLISWDTMIPEDDIVPPEGSQLVQWGDTATGSFRRLGPFRLVSSQQ
jgi:hypothetical protein